jgi:putative spermidine/putrescine transport system substrate-binding protein
MTLHGRLLAQVATVVFAGVMVGLPQAGSAVDYNKIKELADQDGITELRMTEAGGASGDSIQAGYVEPFQKSSGITVIRENPSGLGKLRAMVVAGSVSSVLLELCSTELEQDKAIDLVDPLVWDAIGPMPIFEVAKDEYGYGYQ